MTKLTGASYAKIALIIVFGALILGAIGFGGCSTVWNRGIVGASNMGSANVDAASVKNLNIAWGAGGVDVNVVGEGDSIELIETSTGGMTKAQEMRWNLNGDTLTIDYGQWFSCFMLGRKNLEVRIPQKYAQQFDAVDIDGASGHYNLSDFGCDALNLKLASGEVDARNLTANNLRVDVASGQLDINGRFADRLNVRTASGDTRIVCDDVCPRTIDADIASGLVSVAVPKDSGFAVSIDKASGSFNSTFPLTQNGSTYTTGDGSANVSAHLASGEFRMDASN